MKKTKELRQALKAKSKEFEKATQEYNKEKLPEKLKCFPELILQNESLSEIILELPDDEVKIILKELIVSGKLTALIKEAIQNSPQLKELREKKRVKAERRKLQAEAEQTAPLEGQASEQFAACDCSKSENIAVDGDEVSPSAENCGTDFLVNSEK